MYASLLDTLKRKGYQPGEKPFQKPPVDPTRLNNGE